VFSLRPGTFAPVRATVPAHVLRASRSFSQRNEKRFRSPSRKSCVAASTAHTGDGKVRMRSVNAPPDPASPHSPGLQDGGVRSLRGRTYQDERSLSMRLARLLLPLTFVLLAMTSGCHHRRCCCCGGGYGAFASGPCGACCCYPSAVEGPVPPVAAPAMPPLAAPSMAPLVPQAPIVGSR
jgi:hypothetical protein